MVGRPVSALQLDCLRLHVCLLACDNRHGDILGLQAIAEGARLCADHACAYDCVADRVGTSLWHHVSDILGYASGMSSFAAVGAIDGPAVFHLLRLDQ